MKIFNAECLESEEINKIKKEKNVYYSEKFNCFLMRDDIFTTIDVKYQLINGGTDNYICTNKLENWTECYFEGEGIDFFNKTYKLSDYAETAVETLKYEMDEKGDSFETEDWGLYIEEQLKVAIMVCIGSELKDEIKELKSNKYDVNILISAF
jgi:hypothetical protein